MSQKIAIDARILSKSTGTYARYLLKHLQELDTRGLEFDVLLRREDMDKWQPSAPNFRAVEAEYRDFTFAEQLGFYKQLQAGKYDLVHFCMQQQPALYQGKKVTTFHDLTLLKWKNPAKNQLVFTIKQFAARLVFWSSLKTATHIIAPSHYSAEDIKKFVKVPDSRISVTYLAAEVDSFPSEVDNSLIPSDPYVLYVGNFFSYKNVEVLGQAVNSLLSEFPNLKLVLVGRLDEAAEQLQEKFRNQGLENIIFTGFISDAQRDALYDSAQAYVFPSLMEGFGLPGLEAMTHRVPVIAADATCLPEVYQDAALYFDPKNPAALAKQIRALLTQPELKQDLVNKGQKLLQQYSWEKTAQETLAIYRQALEGK